MGHTGSRARCSAMWLLCCVTSPVTSSQLCHCWAGGAGDCGGTQGEELGARQRVCPPHCWGRAAAGTGSRSNHVSSWVIFSSGNTSG